MTAPLRSMPSLPRSKEAGPGCRPQPACGDHGQSGRHQCPRLGKIYDDLQHRLCRSAPWRFLRARGRTGRRGTRTTNSPSEPRSQERVKELKAADEHGSTPITYVSYQRLSAFICGLIRSHLFARLDRIHHELVAALFSVDHNQEQVLLSGLLNEFGRFAIAFGIQLKALPVPADESERLAL